jgi:hypothetical protein
VAKLNEQSGMRRWVAVAALALTAAAGAAVADPPARVARLAYVDGTVSFSPAGDDEWVRAVPNRPLVAGDRLWTDRDGRAELQMANKSLRLGAFTSVALLNVDDRIEQIELTQGVLHLSVRRLSDGETIEIDTPNFAFSVTGPGVYRFEVDPGDQSSLLVVRRGEGEVYGDRNAYVIVAGQAFRYWGTDLRDQEYLQPPAIDEFESWAASRDRRYANLASARYVAPGMIGYEDLDAHGTWRVVGDYGNVWIPRDVPAGWAPYRNGHWSWIDPWGWTWIDDAPWGFAPFHYGRWVDVGNRWGWVPGPSRVRPVYAPALVAFVGGGGWSVSVSSGPAIGWFPLAPGEVYRPAYAVSRDYFTRVNVANTVINNTYVTNVYNNRDAPHARYAHLRRPAAITAVPQAAFAQAQPVQRARLSVAPEVMNKAEVLPLAKIAPERVSVRGSAPAARARPPAAAVDKPVVAKAPPPPAPLPLATKLPMLSATPGQPLDRPPRGAGIPARAGQGAQAPAAGSDAPQRHVRVVETPPPKPAPTASSAGRGNAADRAAGEAPRAAGPSRQGAMMRRAEPVDPAPPVFSVPPTNGGGSRGAPREREAAPPATPPGAAAPEVAAPAPPWRGVGRRGAEGEAAAPPGRLERGSAPAAQAPLQRAPEGPRAPTAQMPPSQAPDVAPSQGGPRFDSRPPPGQGGSSRSQENRDSPAAEKPPGPRQARAPAADQQGPLQRPAADQQGPLQRPAAAPQPPSPATRTQPAAQPQSPPQAAPPQEQPQPSAAPPRDERGKGKGKGSDKRDERDDRKP